MTAPLLEVTGLTTYFFTAVGVVKAVEEVSFTLKRGEVLGLIGESGSGKTVTGFSLIGLIDEPGRIVGGSVKLDGRELVGLPGNALRSIRGRKISMVFQDPMMTLNPVLTIATQMRLAIEAHETVSKAVARSRSVAVLEKVGIPSPATRLDNYPHQFSGGMRQRVAIAIALLHRPALIIADEPTTALDVSIQAQILAEMKTLVDELGTSMIWISHDLATVSSIADRIAVMYAGRVVEAGSVGRVLSDPRHPYTEGLLKSLPSRTAAGCALAQIPGTTPSLLDLPPGCAFAPRCPRADAQCALLPPESADEGRSWRCHHPLSRREAA